MNDAAPVDEQALPTVVIVGRPNVGKSTLFNRIIGAQVAIVEDQPGVTRDRKEHEAEWLGYRFVLVDTGGWMPGGGDLDVKVSRQVEAAVRHADLVIFLVDASVGLTDDDALIATWLRKTGRPIIVVTNKADNDRREADRWAFLSLGLGDPVAVSALHGRRAGDLLDEVIGRLPYTVRDDEPSSGGSGAGRGAGSGSGRGTGSGAGSGADRGAGRGPGRRSGRGPDADSDPGSGAGRGAGRGAGPGVDETGTPLWAAGDQPPPRVAVVGRPNVGKSTLFNRLVGEDRAVVHDMPGTTRDAIDTLVHTEDGPIVFVDTAGMRKRGRIDESAEYYSFVRALRAIDDADIALLVIDATEGVTSQDQRLAERVDAAGCPILVMLNKWELIDDAERRLEVQAELRRKLNFIGDAPVLKISALSGKGVHKLRPVLQEAILQYHRRVPTRDVNKVIAAAQQRHPAAHGVKVLYAMQGATDPPTFTLFVNRELPGPYLRYLERSLREAFDFGSTPLKLRVRKRTE